MKHPSYTSITNNLFSLAVLRNDLEESYGPNRTTEPSILTTYYYILGLEYNQM